MSLLGLTLKNNAQNLILNPGFESGSIPTLNDQVPLATNWEKGCALFPDGNQGSPDLFDSRSTNCDVDVPANKWGSRNVRTTGTYRYVGFNGNSNASGLAYFGESVKGKLSQALVSDCSYSISFWASAIDGLATFCSPYTPKGPSVNTKMEVVLRKDGDCTNFKIVYTSGAITQQTWTNFSSTFTLTPAEAAFGYNKVEFRLNNNYATDVSHTHSVYLDDVSLSSIPLMLNVTGNSSFCLNDLLSFTGSSNLTLSNHFWEIAECDASGAYTNPSASWNQWFSGTPGAFTFPALGFITCGNYYKIKLAGGNGCNGWTEFNKIIFINCNPVATAGADVTICTGSCATVGGVPLTGTSYLWTTDVGTTSIIVGYTAQISVCPRSTTVYTLTATSAAGCVASDQVTVFVQDNNPAFSLTPNLNPSDNFYTLFANPTISPLPAGAGYVWFVDEIVSTTNTTVISGSSASSGPCWLSTLSCNFSGYDGPLFTSSGNNPMTAGCSSPAVGHFTAGHTYRIIRGTWSAVCPWQQYAVIAYMTHSQSGDNIHFMEDPNAPDYSSFASSEILITDKPADLLSIYPNPGTGLYTITTANATGTIEVYDVLGNKVKSIELKNNVSDYKLDLSGYSKGIYMLNMISEGKRCSKKIILE
ncbi:MAG: hypothetical protein JWO44_1225 [Bacteroidetes bacterium]|nr:hypothetical protein [Bacteroidota bacterium]